MADDAGGAEYSGSGDPRRSIELLWGVQRGSRRGPKPKLTVPEITTAAVELADQEGLTAVSMRRVAGELAVSPMSLYTYVPSKAELIDLMLDAVYREIPLTEWDGEDWRERLERVARDNRALVERHPWMLRIAMSRPVVGPNLIAKYDHELRAIEGTGLDDVDLDAVLTLVLGFVHSAVRSAIEAAEAGLRTGMDDRRWWAEYGPALESVLDPQRYPTAARVGAAAGELHGAAYGPEHAFEFGLARVLDGIGLLVERAQSGLGS